MVEEFGNLGPLLDAAAGKPFSKGLVNNGRAFPKQQAKIDAKENAAELAERFANQILAKEANKGSNARD